MRCQVDWMDRSSAFRSSVLSLAKSCSIGLRSGLYWGRKIRCAPGAADGAPDCGSFVAAEIVHDHDLPGLERGDEKLFDIGSEAWAIDRPVEDAGRVDPVRAQGREEGQRPPVAVRHRGDQPLSQRCAPVRARHVRLDPGLVDEDEPFRVNLGLMPLPARALARHVGAALLAGAQAFF